ncbi:hypothetical protein GB937_000226 [Aspergillus fischeri]|nr:hypothetical protein GB937_000226 [Aspergillus fischeri]
MISLGVILASNQQLDSALPASLVAIFVTSWAERIKIKLKTINLKGSYFFLQCNTSLLKSINKVCQEIKAKETVISLLFLSISSLITGTSERPTPPQHQTIKVITDQCLTWWLRVGTEENLHYFAALTYYSRIRFAVNRLSYPPPQVVGILRPC